MAECEHEYVTLEHLTLVLLENQDVIDMMTAMGVDPRVVSEDIKSFLSQQTYLVVQGLTKPRKTQTLERAFNRAFTQVLFSGRQHIQVVDLYLSVMAEDKSHAQYFCSKYGLDRSKLVDFWNSNYVEPKNRNKKINPAVKIVKVFITIRPSHNVAIQLKILIPVGIAITIVAAVK